jgi:hypothetical protein
MNFKDLEGSGHSFKVLFQHLPGTEENHKKPQSGQLVSGLRFVPENSEIQSRSLSHSTTTFGIVHLLSCTY